MLHGERITLRPSREADLDTLYTAHVEIRNRGAFFSLGVVSEPAFRQQFAEMASGSTVRGAFFNAGRNQDVLLYSLLRTDPRSWHGTGRDA